MQTEKLSRRFLNIIRKEKRENPNRNSKLAVQKELQKCKKLVGRG